MIYADIVFLYDYEDKKPFKLLEESEEKAIEYLSQWDYGDNYSLDNTSPWEKSDMVYHSEKEGYVLSYNLNLMYIHLCKKIDENEE